MGILALLNHAINLLAPAFWLALLVPILSKIFMKKRPAAHRLLAQIAINFVVCVVLLVAGLLLFGHDGMMLTYLALVACAASCQWWLQRGWRS